MGAILFRIGYNQSISYICMYMCGGKENGSFNFKLCAG